MNVRVATVQSKKTIKTKPSQKQSKEKQGFISSIFASFQKADAPVLNVAPYKQMDKKTGVLVDQRDNLQVYLRVKTTDLVSMNQEDLNRFVNQLTNLCRVYHEPFKVLSLTYSTETTVQQVYWKRMATRYQMQMNHEGVTKAREKILYQRYSLAVENLHRVLWVEKNLKELAFIIVVYAKNQNELERNVKDMKRYGGRQLDLEHMKPADVEKLVFKLQNMNSEM
ncbi:hypothetical protein [Bacillus sp. AFS033286]|uniref:hypothetical protein n=1 Tax=Bacillus sp. AFS033286 TaxID=2033498 RepID=UPI000BFDBB6D|nr:hypothetical protein [Bacillus sp. AFS033286]PGX11849.1 hypothetical protein COE07_11300 [Bacillus sp. AFS033286]